MNDDLSESSQTAFEAWFINEGSQLPASIEDLESAWNAAIEWINDYAD